jgi:hypothetical protein
MKRRLWLVLGLTLLALTVSACFCSLPGEDCPDDMYYDDEAEECVYDEDAANANPGDWDTENWGDNTEEDPGTGFFDDPAGDETEAYDSDLVLAEYQVNGDELFNPDLPDNIPAALEKYQQDENLHYEAWETFTHLMPREYRQSITSFAIFTDGESETLAWVEPITDDLSEWRLGLDAVDVRSDPDEFLYTLLHEYSHIFTLSPPQVDLGGTACPYYETDEGCSEPDSYLNTFFEMFWTDIWDEWQAFQDEPDDALYEDYLDEFYESHEDEFVTAYAATDPSEDIAECWSYFIMEPRPNGDTIAEEKILFFYDYPAMVAMRTDIQTRLAEYFGR